MRVRETLLRAIPGEMEVRADRRAHERLAVASRLSAHLAPLLDEGEIARLTWL
jgi:hypothetical protein